MTGWAKFWSMFLSPATARFILALLALALAAYTLNGLMENEIVPTNRDAFMLAIGLVLGLSTTAFGYYFGSTARGDDKASDVATGKPKDPVHIAPEKGELDLTGAEVK
jgi:hypothetical protein